MPDKKLSRKERQAKAEEKRQEYLEIITGKVVEGVAKDIEGKELHSNINEFIEQLVKIYPEDLPVIRQAVVMFNKVMEKVIKNYKSRKEVSTNVESEQI